MQARQQHATHRPSTTQRRTHAQTTRLSDRPSSAAESAASTLATAAAAAAASPTRLLLLSDGSAFGSWNDGCSLLLHPTMRTATLILPDGSNLRILTATAPSASRTKVAQLLALRNMVDTREAPVLDAAHWSGATFTSDKTFGSARWRLEAREHTQETQEDPSDDQTTTDADDPLILAPVKSLPDGSLRVDALCAPSSDPDADPRVSLTLLPNGQLVRLRYPLLLARKVSALTDEGAQGVRMEYTYADFQQLVPIAEVPPQWNLPLHSALRASHAHAIAREEQRLAAENGGGSADDERANRENAPHNATGQRSQRAADATVQKAEETLRLFGGPSDSTVLRDRRGQTDESTLSCALPLGRQLDVVMDLPVVRSLLPSSSRDGLGVAEQSGLHWPENAGLSVSLLHSLPDSLPRAELIRAIWTNDALYFVLISKKDGSRSGCTGPDSDPASGSDAGVSVVCLVHLDQSSLVLKENGFFEHSLEPLSEADLQAAAAQARAQQQSAGGQTDRYQTRPQIGSRKKIYAPGAVPAVHNASGLNIGELQYDLGRVAKFAARLAQHAAGVCEAREIQATQACRTMASLSTMSVDSCLSSTQLSALRLDPSVVARAASREVVFSSEVCERSFMRGVGEFTAFRDGRTKVRFVDRCLLEMDGARSSLNMLLPNGMALQLALPLTDAEDQQRYGRCYVAPALEFAAWAFQSPAERLEQARRDQMEREWLALQVEQSMRQMALARIRRGQPAEPTAAITAGAETLALTDGHSHPLNQLRSAPATPLPFSLRSPSSSSGSASASSFSMRPEQTEAGPLLALMPPQPSSSAHCSPRATNATMTGGALHSTLTCSSSGAVAAASAALRSPDFSLLSPIAAAPSSSSAAATALPFAADASLSLTQAFSPYGLPPPSSSLHRSVAAECASADPASMSGDLSFWIADLQSRNRAMQQRLANSSMRIQAAVQ